MVYGWPVACLLSTIMPSNDWSFEKFVCFWLVLATITLVGCTQYTQQNTEMSHDNNGQGWEGDDHLLSYLDNAQMQLMKTLTLITRSPNAPICNYDDPSGKDPVTYAIAHAMTTDQRAYCEQFIRGALITLLARYDLMNPPRLVIQYTPMFVGGGVQVAAKTTADLKSDIVFDGNIIGTYSRTRLLATLTHEYGHKLSFNGFITDSDPKGPFTGVGGGRRLLDAVGAAVALFAETNGEIRPATPSSQTSSRMPGIWYDKNGVQVSITQSENRFSFLAASGAVQTGYVVSATEVFYGQVGIMNEAGTRITWQNGTIWKKVVPFTAPDISGNWLSPIPLSVVQSGNNFTVYYQGSEYHGYFLSPTELYAPWVSVLGTLNATRNHVDWPPSTVWDRP